MKVDRGSSEYVRAFNAAAGVFDGIALQLSCVVLLVIIWMVICNTFSLMTDSTDKDGWHRSGFRLLTDYGTGKQYLQRDGAIIERKERVYNER